MIGCELMYKSLFGRLFVSFTAIILISFIMLGVLLSQVFESYFIHQKQKLC